MIKIENLHVEVEGTQILKGINLEVKAGETHAIMGPNGSGKSTLAQVLAGHEDYEVTQGKVEYLKKNASFIFSTRSAYFLKLQSDAQDHHHRAV